MTEHEHILVGGNGEDVIVQERGGDALAGGFQVAFDEKLSALEIERNMEWMMRSIAYGVHNSL